jgi:hypothetical protein
MASPKLSFSEACRRAPLSVREWVTPQRVPSDGRWTVRMHSVRIRMSGRRRRPLEREK